VLKRLGALLLLLVAVVPVASSNEPVVMLLEGGQRREIVPVSARTGVEMVYLDQVIAGLGVGVTSDPRGGAVTLTFQGHEVSLYQGKSLVSVGGDLRLLSSPALIEDNRWLVPVDGVPRLLGPLLGRKAEWRAASRVLLVGNVPVPQVTVNTYVSGEVVRVVLQASEKVPFRVSQQEGRVSVAVLRDLIDVPFSEERLTGGIVDWVQYVGGKDNAFAVTLGRRFQQMKAFEQEGPSRLVLEFHAAPLVARPADTASPAAPPSRKAAAGAVHVVVIDPGHGGSEVGAKGPGGTFEKDVTLAIARKLKAVLTNNLGLQVFLTRDRDQEVGLDDRTAIANNYKADLFISIHANASRTASARGSEVYFLSYHASDDESRRVAAAEGEVVPGTAAPPSSDLALILWDMAQAEHLEESSVLASRIQEELAEVTGSQGRGVKQAPFRVLVGAGMPAVLIEVAFISNGEEEKLLASDAYQTKVVSALSRGIGRFDREFQQRAGGGVGARGTP
jgi:N-acetylmuramoyl-L-alanine amidase